ncbi:MAG: transcription initiation factor TFIIIB [Bacillota bacterium]|nr:transcription initiation factor TFIIIB [Bacillota bacterium]
MKVEKCPECGSKNLGRGEFSGYACLTVCNAAGKPGFRGSAVQAVLCSDCGLILELRVKQPHKFAPKTK